MGVLDLVRGRNDTRTAHSIAQTGADEKETNVSVDANSDTLSLEARNEKEILEHPDQVTQDAQIGQQKVEAAALVWSRSVVIATYGW